MQKSRCSASASHSFLAFAKNGYLTPFDVFGGAGKKYWRRCLENPKHEWQLSPNTITNPNRKLSYYPYCSDRRKWTSD